MSYEEQQMMTQQIIEARAAAQRGEPMPFANASGVVQDAYTSEMAAYKAAMERNGQGQN